MAMSQTIVADEFVHISAGSPQLTKRNGHNVIGFDAAATESVIYEFRLDPSYASGSNLTLTLWGIAASATSGAVRNQIEVEGAQAQDFDSDSFDTAVAATSNTANGTSGILFSTVFTLANGDIDAPAAGDWIRIKVSRLGADGADTMTGDWQFVYMTLVQ